MEGQEISYDDGPPPHSDFQGPAFGFSFGDGDLAVKQLMPNAPKWAKSQVRNTLMDSGNIQHSKELFDIT